MTEPTLHSVDKRLDTHEAVCAERWASIRFRISRVEAIGWSTLTLLLAIFAGGCWFFFTKAMKL
jgi:hypothetical protein